MSAAHTPGPWDLQLVESDTGRIRHLCPMDDDGLSLLTVVEHDGKKFAAVYKDDDARLISAAPDLLEALCIAKQFMEIARDWNIDEVEINGDMRSTYDLLEIVNAAIAKATGGQS